MITKSEQPIINTAREYILREIAENGLCKVNGLGEFSVRQVAYRDIQDGEMKTALTLGFRPFTAAKKVAKEFGGVPKKAKKKKSTKQKSVKASKVITPPQSTYVGDFKKVEPKPEQTLTPGETNVEEPKSKPLPRKKGGFKFKL